MASAETAKLWVALNLKDGLSSGIKRAGMALNKFDKGAGRVGAGVAQMGLGAARAGVIVGGALAGAVAVATKSWIDYQDAFAGVRKTVEASESEFKALSDGFRQMATEIPIAATEFARIGELGGALGIQPEDLLSFTKTVALLGVTTDVAVDDAAMALGQLSNVMRLTGDDYDNFAATLVDLGNKGASTEGQILEITKRAGQSATLVGMAADETLGWSAAIANLGLQPELAGTAFDLFLQKTLSTVSEGGKGLKLLAETAGMTGKEFRAAFADDASGALTDFIKGLAKLPAAERLGVVQAIFGKRTGLTRTILGLADSVDRNLVPSLDNAGKAWEDNTALAEEARKRFETVKNSVLLLKNNLVEAAMVFGEGVAPAIGRAATKLAEFLRQGENRTMLKRLGEDVGRAIDGVDWGRLLDTAKGLASALQPALALVVQLGGLIANLPPGLLGAGAGLVVTNQLSGGLIGAGLGNIFGGLGEVLTKSILARLPVIGPGFVQPVFVTNMGAGGLGGGALPGLGGLGGAAAGAAGGLGAAGAISAGIPIALGALMLAAPYIFKGKPGSGPTATAIQGGQGTLSWQQTGMMQGLIPSFTTLAQQAGSRSIVPAIQAEGIRDRGQERLGTTQALTEMRTEAAQQRMQAAAARATDLQSLDADRQASAKLSMANARLEAIRRKKTSFTSVTNVNIPITIRDIQNIQNKRRRIVKRSVLENT